MKPNVMALATQFSEEAWRPIKGQNTVKAEVQTEPLCVMPEPLVWVKGIVSDHQFLFIPAGAQTPTAINRQFTLHDEPVGNYTRIYLSDAGLNELGWRGKGFLYPDDKGWNVVGTLVGQQVLFGQPAHKKSVVLNIPEHVKRAQAIDEFGWVQLLVTKVIAVELELVTCTPITEE